VRTELPNLRASLADKHAQTLLRAADYEGAVEAYEQATGYAPAYALPWAGLALALARLGKWSEAARAAKQALDLEPEAREPGVLRTAGLAATALGDWERARWAWRELRLPVTEGRGPIEEDFGLAAIRVNRSKRPSELWCHRIDPVSARVVAIPHPMSGHAYGDLLLHDPNPTGERVRQTDTWPAFESLCVVEPSAHDTWTVTVVAPTAADLSELSARLATVQAVLEDWSPPPPFQVPWRRWVAERRVGIAARDMSFLGALNAWCEEGRERSFLKPDLGFSRASR
jgi:hypothetical protein